MVQGLSAFKSISKMYLHWGWFRLFLLSALFRNVFPLSVKLRSTNNVFFLQVTSEAYVFCYKLQKLACGGAVGFSGGAFCGSFCTADTVGTPLTMLFFSTCSTTSFHNCYQDILTYCIDCAFVSSFTSFSSNLKEMPF